MTDVQTPSSHLISPSAPRDHFEFSFTPFLRQNFHHALASDVPVCNAYREGLCPRGPTCPERHPAPSRLSTATSPATTGPISGHGTLVCKHFLKGLCKKGIKCEYLHEYNLRALPECQMFVRSGRLSCQNGEDCLYQHAPEEKRRPRCEHYDQGFCPLGPRCAKKHVRNKLCPYYLVGFCPQGRACQFGAHARFREDLPPPQPMHQKTEEDLARERMKILELQEKEHERQREWRKEHAWDSRFQWGRYRGKK